MSLRDIYTNTKSGMPVISFEIFPPKGDNLQTKIDDLFIELKKLKAFNPALISVTYGAGGSNRENSIGIVQRIKNELDVTPMPHFTCVCSSKQYICDYLDMIVNAGIENILALRGDEPQDIDVCYKDFVYANELVEFIKGRTNLSIGVAGYPECHPSCSSLEKDIENLKCKVDAGADAVYTQLFFDNNYYFEFVQMARDVGIEIPIIPGIMPITNLNQISRMTQMCGTKIPKNLISRLEQYKNDPNGLKKIGVEFASAQCAQLIEAGVSGLHFYTLNKAESVKDIIENLSLAV